MPWINLSEKTFCFWREKNCTEENIYTVKACHIYSACQHIKTWKSLLFQIEFSSQNCLLFGYIIFVYDVKRTEFICCMTLWVCGCINMVEYEQRAKHFFFQNFLLTFIQSSRNSNKYLTNFTCNHIKQHALKSTD